MQQISEDLERTSIIKRVGENDVRKDELGSKFTYATILLPGGDTHKTVIDASLLNVITDLSKHHLQFLPVEVLILRKNGKKFSKTYFSTADQSPSASCFIQFSHKDWK